MKLILIAICLFAISCNDEKQVKSESISRNIIDSLNFPQPRLPVMYEKYMPDTNQNFSNWDAFSAYTKPLQKEFFTIKLKNGDLLQQDLSDTAIFIRNQFTVLLDYLFIKHIAVLPQNNMSMSMLEYGIGVPGSTSSHRRLELFHSFPTAIQNNEIGQRVFKNIEVSFYDKNIGFDILEFNNVELYDRKGNKTLWKDLFIKTTEYKIIIFGASWCSPCLVQERKLRKHFDKIDSSRISVVGISIDNNLAKFSDYIQRENFPWNVYRIEGETENPIMKRLGFTGIPRNTLVDSKGKIVKEDLDIVEILRYLKIEIPVL